MNDWFVKLAKYFFITFLLTSCSLVNKPFSAVDNIAEYAETLFMHQHSLTQQLIMLFDENANLSEDDEEIILQAELQMHDACRLLNEYANREIDGQRMSVLFKRRVQKSFKACEASVDILEALLLKIPDAEVN